MSLIVISMFLVFLVLVIYSYLTRKFQYWAVRGVPFVKPEIPYGNVKGLGTKMCNALVLQNLYNKMKGQGLFFGAFYYTRPVCVPMDLDLIKNILVRDFNHFHDRGWYENREVDILTGNILSLTGDDWSTMRKKLSPTFSSGKIKLMFPILHQVAKDLEDFVTPFADSKSSIDIKDIMTRFTTDIIGSTAFGIECRSIFNPNHPLRVNGLKTINMSKFDFIKFFLLNNVPEVGKMFKIKLWKTEVATFFTNLLRDTIDYREKNNIQKKDFLSLLMQLKNTGTIEGEKDALGHITFNELVAQLFLFLIAGYETSSSTMTYVIYLLTIHKEIQDRAREEVNRVLEKYNGVLTYEAISELSYLEQIIKESLRIYPILDHLPRTTTKDYIVQGTNQLLEKGTQVMVPVFAIQRDPEYYPEPEKFDPERFTPENIAKRHPCAWLPFGDGPRGCIGMRFGFIQIKLGLATLLAKFKFEMTDETPLSLEFQANSVVLASKCNIFVKFSNI